MGDRGNIAVRTRGKKLGDLGSCVLFYTHWSGHDAPRVVRDALVAGKGRWTDPPYLARVVFQKLLNGDDGTTGYGIDTGICDNEYPLLVVDAVDGKILLFGRKDFEGGKAVANDAPVTEPAEPVKAWAFEEFAALKFDEDNRPPWAVIDPERYPE